MIKCINCEEVIVEIYDTTYCNYNSPKYYKGQHTGDVYFCDNCETLQIHRVNEDIIEPFYY